MKWVYIEHGGGVARVIVNGNRIEENININITSGIYLTANIQNGPQKRCNKGKQG